MRPAQRAKHEWIKCHLRLRGSSLAKVAQELGLSPATVTIVSQGMRKSHRIESTISQKLGVPAAQLWPEKYI